MLWLHPRFLPCYLCLRSPLCDFIPVPPLNTDCIVCMYVYILGKENSNNNTSCCLFPAAIRGVDLVSAAYAAAAEAGARSRSSSIA